VAYGIWQRFFSHAARVDAVHAACVAEFAAGQATVRSQLQAPSPRPGDPVGAAVNDLSQGLGRLVDQVAGGLSDAACGALREACRLDFEGEACRRARAHFR
jgi:hypothetical protein